MSSNPNPRLPLPVARLALRSRNALSALERHNAAWHAIEVSVRIGVSLRPPAEWRALARASLGSWVGALEPRRGSVRDAALLELFAHLSEVGLGKRSERASVEPRELLDALPAYRNQVKGHGADKGEGFCEEAARVLLAGLEAAWDSGLFAAPNGRVVFVESVAIRTDGTRAGRVFDLSGIEGQLTDPGGTVLPEHVLPGRLYWQTEAGWKSLHPLLLYSAGDVRERESLHCFNGLGRRAAYLDYATGEVLRGDQLEREFPGVEAELRELLQEPATAGDTDLPAAESGDRFGGYELLGKLGEGGMGVVYLARQRSLDRFVALKMLPVARSSDPVALARFRREVRALSRCEHPNVVKILDSGDHGGTWYYAMDFVDGADLAEVAEQLSETGEFASAVTTAYERRLREHPELFDHLPRIPRQSSARPAGQSRYLDAARFFRDAARGVQHLHDNGVLHRDVKPANLMVCRSDGRAVVMDLGLALLEASAPSLTESDQIVGTLRYLPPEQLQRNLIAVDERADVYSIGASLYELLCDRPFFDGDSRPRLIEQVLREQPAPIAKVAPEVPRDLRTIVQKATEKDARLRYASAAALADDLDAFLEDRPIAAQPPTLRYLFGLAIRRNPGIAATVALAALTLIVVTGLFIQSLRRANEQIQRMADRSVETVLEEEARLFPETPSTVPAMRAWMDSADHFLSRRPALENDDSGTLMYQGEEGPVTVARHLELLDCLDAARARVSKRITDAESLPERTLDHPRWPEAIASIAQSERYRRDDGEPLELSPQLGLVPLQQHPETGLWEFAHLLSGSMPEIADETTGRLVLRPENCIVLILLPGDERYEAGSLVPGYMMKPHLRDVRVAPYFHSKYEVTQAQWTRIRGSNPSSFRLGQERDDWLFSSLHPVESVGWDECQLTARYLALELQTEMQFEYASLAGRSGRVIGEYTYWGDLETVLSELENIADATSMEGYEARVGTPGPWDDGYRFHAPVGSFRGNGFGLYDMAGNVVEWCRDDYVGFPDDDFERADGLVSRPLGEAGHKSVRGGSWYLGLQHIGSSYRQSSPRNIFNYTIGVRFVRGIEPAM